MVVPIGDKAAEQIGAPTAQTVGNRMLGRMESGPITLDANDVMGQFGTLIDTFATTQTVIDNTDDNAEETSFLDLNHYRKHR